MRPSFQFYPGDWRSNTKLRRCTFAERGIWIDLLCMLHDSKEYGVLRWPLKDLAQALGCRAANLLVLREEAIKGRCAIGRRLTAARIDTLKAA